MGREEEGNDMIIKMNGRETIINRGRGEMKGIHKCPFRAARFALLCSVGFSKSLIPL